MAKQYQWRKASTIISGGYPGENPGVIGGDTSWVTTDTLSGNTTAQYYYRDSDYAQNANSSRVVVDIAESWTASIDNRNNLTVTLTTTVNSIVRDDVQGTPGTNTRNIFIRREEGGPVLWQLLNDPINTAHTILNTPITLDSYTFTLAPGDNLERGSIYFRNNVTGYDSEPVPSIYVDLLWLGTAFKNILPADYRVFATWDGSNWLSHNRNAGWSGIWDGSTFKEERSLDGGVGNDNPPYVQHSDGWKNGRLVGQE